MWAGRSTGSARTARETARDVARHGHTALAAGMGKGEWDDEVEGGAGGMRMRRGWMRRQSQIL